MDKPASSLYPHNISSILETGIRATATKLDDLDIHRRLDVRLLAPSENERGWDVFILDYNVGGPIGTVCEKKPLRILEIIRVIKMTYLFRFWNLVDKHIKLYFLPCGELKEWSLYCLQFGNIK